MNDNNVQRRLLVIGGTVWIATGCLGLFASTVVDGISKIMLIAPFLIGVFLFFLAIKGFTADRAEANAAAAPNEHDEIANVAPTAVEDRAATVFPTKKPA